MQPRDSRRLPAEGASTRWSRIVNRSRAVAYATRDLFSGRRADAPAPDGPRRGQPARRKFALTVGCYANWSDFDEALNFLTPGASGAWNDVAFVRAGSAPTDWTGIFNQPHRQAIEFVASRNRVFFAIGEPPTRVHRPLHLGQGQGSTVFTCDQNLVAENDGARKYVLTPPMLRTWSVRRTFDELRQHAVRDKPRSLSWITSDTATLAGHRRRLAFLARLRKEVTLDLFGRGFHRVYDKWEVLAPYRYSIAFENTRAPYYFTEKLMDCFVCEAMPIYVGSPQIAEFFPSESLVVIDPDAVDVADQVRAVVASNRWKSNRDAILEAKRRVLYEFNLFAMLERQLSGATSPAQPPARIRIEPVALHVPHERESPS